MNPKIKAGLMFAVAVIVSLYAIRMIQTYLLPKAPESIKKVANAVLPKT